MTKKVFLALTFLFIFSILAAHVYLTRIAIEPQSCVFTHEAEASNSIQTQEGLFPILETGLWGFMDSTGRVIIEPKFREVDTFSEGLAAFKSIYDGRWGYIDTSGEIVIEPVYDAAFSFREGRAIVIVSGSYGAIDKAGEYVIEPIHKRIEGFFQGRAFILVDTSWMLVDENGNYVTQNSFKQVNSFREGLASFVGFNGDYSVSGYLNRNGEVSILLPDELNVHIEALGFTQGRAVVSRKKPTSLSHLFSPWEWGDGVYGLIDKSGEVVVPTRYDFIMVDSNCTARVAIRDRYGVIDLSGNVLIPMRYSYLGGFSEGLVIAQRIPDGKYGYINEQGRFIIEPIQVIDDFMRFSNFRNFYDGRALFEGTNGKYGYIDKQGNLVIEPVFDKAFPFVDRLAKFENSGQWGYIDTAGSIVWRSEAEE